MTGPMPDDSRLITDESPEFHRKSADPEIRTLYVDQSEGRVTIVWDREPVEPGEHADRVRLVLLGDNFSQHVDLPVSALRTIAERIAEL